MLSVPSGESLRLEPLHGTVKKNVALIRKACASAWSNPPFRCTGILVDVKPDCSLFSFFPLYLSTSPFPHGGFKTVVDGGCLSTSSASIIVTFLIEQKKKKTNHQIIATLLFASAADSN